MIGRTISHYEILEKLGEGGMGVVYRARDTMLDRIVALKFLHPHAIGGAADSTRFIREARTAASLDHPNICTVYEVGEADGRTFISMAYIEGRSLGERISSGPVPLDEALDIALQAAEGLRAAHGKGIVHRDIKSANLMLASDGRVKVMDFGLAKSAGATKMTMTGTVLGTAAYMSPEQALGKPVDERSDIWSLGVVLYEMLTGRLPFAGEHDPALMYAIVNMRQEPPTELDPAIPLEVEQLMDRMLEKDPGKRYQDAGELIADLEELRESLHLLPRRSRLALRLRRRRRRILSIAAAAAVILIAAAAGVWYFTGNARAIDSIAVLPFENLTGNAGEDQYVDGITFALTSALGQAGGFEKVRPYRSMIRFKGTDKSPGEIADRMDVKIILAGAIGVEGGKIKASVELIDRRSERQLWADQFEFGREKLETIIENILGEVHSCAQIVISEDAKASVANLRSDDPRANERYMMGRALALTWSRENLEKGIELLEEAVRLDSTFALAYAVLACAYTDYGTMYTSGEDEYPKAKKVALKALDLNDGLAEAHMALGNFLLVFEWDWEGAEKSYRRAIKLAPDNADVHRDYANYLAFMTRFDEAVSEIKKAIALDPLTVSNQQTLGWILYHAGRFEESIAQFEKVLDFLEEFPDPAKEQQVSRQLIWDYMEMGMYEKALEDIAVWDARWGDNSVRGGTCAMERVAVHVKMGRRDEVEAEIDTMLSQEYVSPHLAEWLGNRDLAFEMLERRYRERDTGMVFLKMMIELKGLRSDPRYHDLARRMNFPE